MTSRYNYMKQSNVQDTDGQNYPDPLSVTFNDVQFTEIPSAKQLSAADLAKFWLYMYNTYGVQEYDDILLTINGIPYLGMEKPGDIIFNVSLKDLQNISTDKLPGVEEN